MCGLLTQTIEEIKEIEVGYSLLPKFGERLMLPKLYNFLESLVSKMKIWIV